MARLLMEKPAPADEDRRGLLLRDGDADDLGRWALDERHRSAALRDAGNLDRAHLIQLLFSDFGIPPTATNLQIYDLYTNGMYALMTNELRANPGLMGPVELTLQRTGATKQEAVAAVLEGRTLPSAPYHSPIASAYESLFTAQGGRAAMCADLVRPAVATFVGTGAPVATGANARFKFRFPDGTTFTVKRDPGQDEQNVRSPAGAADKVAEFPALTAVRPAASLRAGARRGASRAGI